MRRSSWILLAIVFLAVTAAGIHFSRALANPRITALFTLNGLGFLALAAAIAVPRHPRWRAIARRALIGYTGLTLVLFFLWNLIKHEWLLIGFVSVIVEVAIIAGVWWLDRTSSMPHKV